MNVSIKLYVNEECRRFVYTGTTFEELKAQCIKVTNLPPDIALQYADDEGDLVSFSTDAEFLYAVSLLSEPRVFRVHVKTPAPPLNITAAAFVPGSSGNLPERMQVQGDEEWRVRDKWRGGRDGGYNMHQHGHHHMHHAGGGHGRHGPWSGFPAPGAPNQPPADGWGDRFRGRQFKQARVKDYDARFVAHVTHEDGCQVPIGSAFLKIWRFRNNGSARWPQGTALVRVDRANELSAPEAISLATIPAPEEEVDVSVMLQAPRNIGQYTSYFKMMAPNGKKFGQRIRCQILSVSVGGDKKEIWEQLESMGFVKPNERPQSVAQIIAQEQGNLNNVVRAILQQQQNS